MADIKNYRSLLSDLDRGRFKNVYLFFGPETFLINDAVKRFIDKFVSNDFKNLNFIRLNYNSIDFNDIVNACETLPFMDKKKIVVVDDCSFFKSSRTDKDTASDKHSPGISKYIPGLPDTTILILIAGAEVDKRLKAYSAVKKIGDIVEFSPLKGQEMAMWIEGRLKSQGKKISGADAFYFSERVLDSLFDAENEIQKMCAYVGERIQITRDDIDALVPKSLEANVFQLVDSISEKNTGKALYLFNELLLDSEPIPLILAMIIRQYRLLLHTKLLSAKKLSSQEIANRLSVRFFVCSKLQKIIKKYTESDIQKRLYRCLDTDAAIKSGKADQRIAIETLIVEFSR
ncbi:MAG: DNA polymerase III subunit delta [Clostridiales bacterium]|nr:DNA polymerase III subunit delta [Clostridiales bacterium]